MTKQPQPIPAGVTVGNIGIVGRTGSGKTTVAKFMVESELAQGRRVCILDPTGVWWGLRSSADGKKAGFPVVVFGGPHADLQINEAGAATLAKIIGEDSIPIPAVIDLSEFTMSARTRFATAFFEALHAKNRRPLRLVLDEADLFAPQRPMPDQTTMLNRVEHIVRRGRVRGFRVTLITQRPAELHKSVLSQCGTLLAMRLMAPQDRDALGAWIEGQASKEQGKAILAALPQLEVGEGYLWSPELNLLTRRKFPLPATFDSGRAPSDEDEARGPLKFANIDLERIRALVAPAPPAPKAGKQTKDVSLPQRDPLDVTRAIAAARAEGREAGFEEAIKAERRTALKKADALLGNISRQLQQATRILAEAKEILDGYHLRLVAAVDPGQSNGDTMAATKIGDDEKPHIFTIPKGATVGPARHVSELAPVDRIPPARQRILDALAWLESVGVPRANRGQLALLAKQSPKSSGYTNNLGALRTAGLIDYPVDGVVALTIDGQQQARRPERPFNTEDLHRALQEKLRPARWDILQTLIEMHPEAVDRESLAKAVRKSASSSGFTNNLGALRSLGFLDYPTPGTVRAADILFLEA